MTSELFLVIVKSALTRMLQDFNSGKSIRLIDDSTIFIADDADKWRAHINYCIDSVAAPPSKLQIKIESLLEKTSSQVESELKEIE